MAKDIFDYDEMVQNALRTVVFEALRRTAESGLPGSHHFYISFRTDYPGVSLPPRVKEKYPEEITIVLQHQFWNLEVNSKGFSVMVSFDDRNEQIYIPFVAITNFFDPSTKFGLQFAPPAHFEEEKSFLKEASSGETFATSDKANIISIDFSRKK